MVPASCSIWPIKICLIASSFISFFLVHHLRAATAKVDLAEAVFENQRPVPPFDSHEPRSDPSQASRAAV